MSTFPQIHYGFKPRPIENFDFNSGWGGPQKKKVDKVGNKKKKLKKTVPQLLIEKNEKIKNQKNPTNSSTSPVPREVKKDAYKSAIPVPSNKVTSYQRHRKTFSQPDTLQTLKPAPILNPLPFKSDPSPPAPLVAEAEANPTEPTPLHDPQFRITNVPSAANEVDVESTHQALGTLPPFECEAENSPPEVTFVPTNAQEKPADVNKPPRQSSASLTKELQRETFFLAEIGIEETPMTELSLCPSPPDESILIETESERGSLLSYEKWPQDDIGVVMRIGPNDLPLNNIPERQPLCSSPEKEPIDPPSEKASVEDDPKTLSFDPSSILQAEKPGKRKGRVPRRNPNSETAGSSLAKSTRSICSRHEGSFNLISLLPSCIQDKDRALGEILKNQVQFLINLPSTMDEKAHDETERQVKKELRRLTNKKQKQRLPGTGTREIEYQNFILQTIQNKATINGTQLPLSLIAQSSLSPWRSPRVSTSTNKIIIESESDCVKIVNSNDSLWKCLSTKAAMPLRYFCTDEVKDAVESILETSLCSAGWVSLPCNAVNQYACNLYWSWTRQSLDKRRLLQYQKVNHFTEASNLTGKDGLKALVQKYLRVAYNCEKYSSKVNYHVRGSLTDYFNIIPETFIMPTEYSQFLEAFSRSNPKMNTLSTSVDSLEPSASSALLSRRNIRALAELRLRQKSSSSLHSGPGGSVHSHPGKEGSVSPSLAGESEASPTLPPQSGRLPPSFPLCEKRALIPNQSQQKETRSREGVSVPGQSLWIVKPPRSSCGRGIFLTDTLQDIPMLERTIVQRYISNPLLMNGYKFDFRLYVLVTSFQPLEAFLYKEGFARLSTTLYDLDSPDSSSNLHIHLTNSAVQEKVFFERINQKKVLKNFFQLLYQELLLLPPAVIAALIHPTGEVRGEEGEAEEAPSSLIQDGREQSAKKTERGKRIAIEYIHYLFSVIRHRRSVPFHTCIFEVCEIFNGLPPVEDSSIHIEESSIPIVTFLQEPSLTRSDSPPLSSQKDFDSLVEQLTEAPVLTLIDVIQGHSKTSLLRSKQILNSAYGEECYERIWSSVRTLVSAALCCANDTVSNDPNAFELFGFDVLMDNEMRPWLLECNTSPSLAVNNGFDRVIKGGMIRDCVGIVDPPCFDRSSLVEKIVNRKGTPRRSVMGEDRLLQQEVRPIGVMPANMGLFEAIAPSGEWTHTMRMRNRMFAPLKSKELI